MKIYHQITKYGLCAAFILSTNTHASNQKIIFDGISEIPPGYEIVIRKTESPLPSFFEEPTSSYSVKPTRKIERRKAPVTREYIPYTGGSSPFVAHYGHQYFKDVQPYLPYLDDEEGNPYPLDEKGKIYDPKKEIAQGVPIGEKYVDK